MVPSVNGDPGLQLKNSKGNPLVIAVIDTCTSYWLPPSEAIQAAAIVSDDFRDPVDSVLKVSLRRRHGDLSHPNDTPPTKLTSGSYGPTASDRRYPTVEVHGLNTANQTVDVAITRGKLNAVVETSTMPRKEGVLLRHSANMHHGYGHRSMGVAPVLINKDGDIVGEFIFERFMATGLWRLDEAIAEGKKSSGSWVGVHLWGWALRVQR